MDCRESQQQGGWEQSDHRAGSADGSGRAIEPAVRRRCSHRAGSADAIQSGRRAGSAHGRQSGHRAGSAVPKVWSKLQLVKVLDPQFDLCVVIDTDTMAVQDMNELFWHEAPAAVWRGTKTLLQGKKRDERSYGTAGGQGGERPLGGFNGTWC